MYADIWSQLMHGFAVALQPEYLAYSFAGSLLGTVVGVLPGIGPAGALALLLPIVLSLDPTGAIIMLAAAYTGSMYGGSTASILLRVPGDTSAVIACLDGHEMARAGRAGPALCIAAIGSYIAGTMAVVGLMLMAPVIADYALAFGAPEYFALYIFGLTAVASLVAKSLLKALMALTLGLMLSTVGQDLMGVPRFTFDLVALWDGVQFLSVTLGLFALSEVLDNAKLLRKNSLGKVLKHRVYIALKEIKECLGAIFRGGAIGFSVGVIPGCGAATASFIDYAFERQISRHPERFGKGEIKGVAGPESANNAASAGAFVPMLALGVPGSATTAVMLGAFYMLNIQPGPLLFMERPDVFWGMVAALYVGNIMLLILNLPLIGIFVKILHTPMRILLPLIITICVAGIYSNDGLVSSLILFALFGILGYYMRRHDYPLVPVILGVVLGEPMEESFRQSMMMSQGNLLAFMNHPIVLTFLVLALLFLALPRLAKRRPAVGDE